MVPTVVLGVTLPPEGDALVVLAHKLEGRGARWGWWGAGGRRDGVGGGQGGGETGLVGPGELRLSFKGQQCFREMAAGLECVRRRGWTESWGVASVGRPEEGCLYGRAQEGAG